MRELRRPSARGSFSERSRCSARRWHAVIGTGSTDLSCKKCGKYSTLKSNKGIYEELKRQGSYLWVQSPLICECGNTTRFRKYGKTRSGSDRWQCRDCKKTMSLGKPTRSQEEAAQKRVGLRSPRQQIANRSDRRDFKPARRRIEKSTSFTSNAAYLQPSANEIAQQEF